jgi:hypothetical protein
LAEGKVTVSDQPAGKEHPQNPLNIFSHHSQTFFRRHWNSGKRLPSNKKNAAGAVVTRQVFCAISVLYNRKNRKRSQLLAPQGKAHFCGKNSNGEKRWGTVERFLVGRAGILPAFSLWERKPEVSQTRTCRNGGAVGDQRTCGHEIGFSLFGVLRAMSVLAEAGN